MPYSCRNNNDYKSAYKMGVNTTKELCGICLDSVIQGQDKNRRRSKHWQSSSTGSVCDSSYAKHQYLCGCNNKKGAQTRQNEHAKHTTAILNAAEAIVDSVCASGVVAGGLGSVSTATSDYKVANHHSSSNNNREGSSSHRQRHRQGSETSKFDNNKSSSASRTDAIMTMTTDQKGSSSSRKTKHYSSKHPSPQTQAHAQAVDEFKRKYNIAKAASSYSSHPNPRHSSSSQERGVPTDSDIDDYILAEAGTADTDAATYLNKEPYTMVLVSSPANNNSKSAHQTQEGRSNRIGDLTKNGKKKKKQGTTDSHSSQKSLFDDNSSAGLSILSSQDENNNNNNSSSNNNNNNNNNNNDKTNGSTTVTDSTTEANKISTKRINRFLQNLSKDKAITDLPYKSIANSNLEEVPNSLPPLKFDSRIQRESTSRSSCGESRDDDRYTANPTSSDQQQQRQQSSPPRNGYHYSGPIPISSRIHHFGKRQDDDEVALIDKNETSKPKQNLTHLDVTIGDDDSESDEDDEEDDITGPRLAASATLETLDTPTPEDYADAYEGIHVAAPSPSHSTATPMFSNIRTTVEPKLQTIRTRVPTPRHLPPADNHQQPLSPTAMKKERKELYVVKEKLQWTKNKLESTQYELSVLKGIKDLYQRELECKALECKLAQWRLSHKPLAVDTQATPLTAATSAADDSQKAAIQSEGEMRQDHDEPKLTLDHDDDEDSIGESFSSLSLKTCNEPAEEEHATVAAVTNTSDGTNNTEQESVSMGQRLVMQTLMGCTFVVVIAVLVWQHAKFMFVILRLYYQKLGEAFSGHMAVRLFAEGSVLGDSLVLFQTVAMERITSYLETGRSILALVYWLVRGGIWWVSDIDINDMVASAQKAASDLLDWVLHSVMTFFGVPQASSMKALDAPA